MSEQWTRESGDVNEHVQVSQHGLHEHRAEVVEDVATARYETISKTTQLIWLLFGILEALIALRVMLKLIAANPGSPFASLVYGFTDLFLWPFFGLTVTPSAGGMVLEIPAVIAMFVYALLAWVIVKLIWLFFYQRPTRRVTTYDRDHIQ